MSDKKNVLITCGTTQNTLYISVEGDSWKERLKNPMYNLCVE